jgi:hypothetical protein
VLTAETVHRHAPGGKPDSSAKIELFRPRARRRGNSTPSRGRKLRGDFAPVPRRALHAKLPELCA